MELYILSKQDLSILSICKLADYQINLDEETNAKSTFTLMKTNGLKKGNYMTLNGLYRQFIFVIDDVQTEKESDVVTVTALDISNIFDRKVIEKNIDTMKSKSIEEFLANTISENFVNSDDTALNVNYIEIYWHTNTKGNVATNSENGLYNFHTFLTNCRQYKNIYTDFKLENLGNPQTVEGKRISVEAKNRKIIDISLHGESTQSGTPTPENKVDIENIEGNIEFKVEGKNRFDCANSKIIYNNGNTLYERLTNGLKIISSGGQYNMLYFLVDTVENLKGKTLTLSSDILFSKENQWTTLGLFYTDTNGGNRTTLINNNNITSKGKYQVAGQVSEGENRYYVCIGLRPNIASNYASGDYTIYDNLQIEYGETPTDYEPYKSQVAYFPLGEGQKLMKGSYLADDGIHHNFKEGLANGTSTTFEDAKENGKFYCNKKASGNLEGKTIAFDTEVTDAIVQYELAEPEIVPYTVEQQEAWNKIKNITLFEGVNHISSEANMVLKYYPLKTVGLKFVLRIDIENKQETTELIDTTLSEVTDYNKIYEEDVTAKVQVYIREDGSEYNLYLKTDRTTTTNKDDPDRASGKIEVISVETADKAEEEALNVMKGNNYKHLVEFKITKTSKLMDITKLHIRKTYKNQNRRRYI